MSSGLTGQYTPILSADVVKCYKPVLRVDVLVPTTLGLPQEASVFVSSHAFDVMGAKVYGCQGAWIKHTRAQGR